MRLQSPSAIASIAPSMRRNGSTESLVDAGFLPSMVAFCSGICDEIDWTMGLAALPVLHTQICRQALHEILHAKNQRPTCSTAYNDFSESMKQALAICSVRGIALKTVLERMLGQSKVCTMITHEAACDHYDRSQVSGLSPHSQ